MRHMDYAVSMKDLSPKPLYLVYRQLAVYTICCG